MDHVDAWKSERLLDGTYRLRSEMGGGGTNSVWEEPILELEDFSPNGKTAVLENLNKNM